MTLSLKAIVWRTLVTAAVLILLIASFYAEENLRGLRAWEKAEAEITARGESLNWHDYIPHPVPDDQNFYRAPMMTEWFVRSTNGSTSAALAPLMANPENSNNDIDQISASNYLAWVAAYDPEFAKIRDALNRPAAQIWGDYTIPFRQLAPNFVSYRTLGQVLTHRARCHLLLGEPDQALADLTLLHKLSLTLVKTGKPAWLVTAMVHMGVTGLYADAVACGLESHSWREPELAALQKQLAEIHLPTLVASSFQAERAGCCHLLDRSMSPDELIKLFNSSIPHSELGWWFIPGGWLDQNKAVIATLEEQFIASINLTNQTISPFKANATNLRLNQTFRHTTPWNFLAALCTPNFSKAAETTARWQTWADQAQIACALERYRLANGKYPATLAALVPQFLEKIPCDVITGKPMTYSRKDEQNFLLYSVGWNEVDEGGIIARKGDGTEDRDQGDWVWHYPHP